MEILNQLKSVYTTLNSMTISGDANIDKMCGCFYVIKQIIQQLEVEENDRMKERINTEQVLPTE